MCVIAWSRSQPSNADPPATLRNVLASSGIGRPAVFDDLGLVVVVAPLGSLVDKPSFVQELLSGADSGVLRTLGNGNRVHAWGETRHAGVDDEHSLSFEVADEPEALIVQDGAIVIAPPAPAETEPTTASLSTSNTITVPNSFWRLIEVNHESCWLFLLSTH